MRSRDFSTTSMENAWRLKGYRTLKQIRRSCLEVCFGIFLGYFFLPCGLLQPYSIQPASSAKIHPPFALTERAPPTSFVGASCLGHSISQVPIL